jgi:hypothetical protein
VSLLSEEDEVARSIARRPFSNGFECESWMAHWCERCANESDCPLLAVLFIHERTPGPWTVVQPHGLADRYRCEEFKER